MIFLRQEYRSAATSRDLVDPVSVSAEHDRLAVAAPGHPGDLPTRGPAGGSLQIVVADPPSCTDTRRSSPSAGNTRSRLSGDHVR